MEGRRRRQRWTTERAGLSRPVTGRPPPLRKLTTDHLAVVYQPIVDLRDGKTFAHEALVRCRVEAYKSPIILFEQALEQQCVGRLGRTIREVTFSQGPVDRLFVNLHPEELNSRWLIRPDDPLSLFEGQLYLEITESAALEYFELCSKVLREICERTGAFLVVDDFGAGFSNLKRVIDLHPHVVKLDRALISGIDSNRRQRLLVEQLVNMCSVLEAKVVAEGIETVEELKAVREAGVQYGQGYLLARPGFPIPEVSWPL